MNALRLRSLALALPLLLSAACSPALIPHTRIADTKDTRAILDVVREYKNAFEAKDAAAIVALASERYLDARDSISYATLQDELQKDFDRVKQVQLDIQVRRIDVNGDRAHVDYFYSSSWLLDAADEAWRTEADDKRMVLVREDREWKVLSGF